MDIKLEFDDQDRKVILDLLNEIKKLNSTLSGLGIRSNTPSNGDTLRECNAVDSSTTPLFKKFEILDDAYYYPKDLMQLLNFGKNAVYEFIQENNIPKIKGKYRVQGRKLKTILEGANQARNN